MGRGAERDTEAGGLSLKHVVVFRELSTLIGDTG